MSSDARERDWLETIVENCERIDGYLGDRTEQDFAESGLIRDAVERCLERIAEAAVRLGPERLKAIAPDLALHELRGLGNILRHEYDRVDPRIIWNTARYDLPPFKAACLAELR